MAVQFGSGFTVRSNFWTDFKAAFLSKKFLLQYDDNGTVYTVYGYDGPEVNICTIWKGTLPDSIIAGGYSQVQNDADKTDFENNYKATANARISSLIATDVPQLTTNSQTVSGYTDTSAATNRLLRSTAYVEPTSSARRSIASTSGGDSSGGGGTRTVRITYYDDSGNGPFTEDLTLAGTVGVNTVSATMRFIERIQSLTIGANGTNLGTITLYSAIDKGGSAISTIAIGDGETWYAHHYVGAGKICYVTSLNAGSFGNSYRLYMTAVNPLNANAYAPQIGPLQRLSNTSESLFIPFTVPYKISGLTRLEMIVRADSATAGVAFASFSFYEI